MKMGYYPGCSLESSALNYGLSTEKAFKLLGIDLEELHDWTCCGASSGHSVDLKLARKLSARNLEIAAERNMDLVVPCALCFNNLKHAQKALEEGSIQSKIGTAAQTEVYDIASVLAREDILKEMKKLVKNPLEGVRTVSYYGCQVDRPPKVTDSKEHENPTSIDKVVKALGGTTIDWSYKTSCCGAGNSMLRQDMADFLLERLIKRVSKTGADIIVVACPMCHVNMEMNQEKYVAKGAIPRIIPTLYVTDLVLMALGDPSVSKFIEMNLLDSAGMLRELGMAV